MTAPPLPDVPCLKIRMTGKDDTSNDWGTRFYVRYGGSAPSGANCISIATFVEGLFSSSLAQLMHPALSLTEVDVLDIATTSGLSGQWTGNTPGSRSGGILPVQVAADVEYGIARRYRGGKPRGYFPFGVVSDMQDQANWLPEFVNALNTQVPAFFHGVNAIVAGTVGPFQHVNLSYYDGFKNITNSSGRERAVPTYRPVALHDDITGYFAKVEMGSQKRRRTATTP